MNNKRLRKVNNHTISGSIRTSIWKLAIPMMGGAILHDLFSLADMFFVGRLGHEAVAALTISGFIISVIMMAIIGIATGTTALIAHFTGKKDYDSADLVLFQTVVVSVVGSIIMVFIGLFSTEFLLKLFGATAEIIPAAAEYLKIGFIWSIFIFLFIGFNQALRGSGDVDVPLKVLILANVINIIIDPMFIFGFGIIPSMGVAGSAIATVLSRGIGVVILFMHFMFGHSSLHFHKKVFKINFTIIGRMIKIGFFASFEVLLRQISILLLARIVASFGAVSLAAFGIAMRLRLSIIMLGMGMADTASVLIGQNMGAGNAERATKLGMKILKYFELMIIPVAIVFFVFSQAIITIFNNHPEVVRTGSMFLRLVAVTLPFLAVALILGRGVTGAGDTIAPAVMTGISQLGLRVPVAYVMSIVFGFGIIGVWLGINASDILQGLAMLWYFKKGYWQKRYHKHRVILEQGGFAGI